MNFSWLEKQLEHFLGAPIADCRQEELIKKWEKFKKLNIMVENIARNYGLSLEVLDVDFNAGFFTAYAYICWGVLYREDDILPAFARAPVFYITWGTDSPVSIYVVAKKIELIEHSETWEAEHVVSAVCFAAALVPYTEDTKHLVYDDDAIRIDVGGRSVNIVTRDGKLIEPQQWASFLRKFLPHNIATYLCKEIISLTTQ